MIRITRLSLEEEIRVKKGKSTQHNPYTVSVSMKGLYDTKKGMFVKLGDVRKLIKKFNYSTLNKYFRNPSVENLSRYFALKLIRAYSKLIIEVTVSVYNSNSSVATSTILNPKFQKEDPMKIEELPQEAKSEISSEVNAIAYSLELHPDDIYKALALLEQQRSHG
jgi:6-pyruvoyl-tetrahydropterin synthase